MRLNGWIAGQLCLALVGCSQAGGTAETKPEAKKEAAATLDAGEEFALSSIQGDLKTIRERLKGDDPLSITITCGATRAMAEKLAPKAPAVPAIAAAVKEASTLCDHDLPLALAEFATGKAESARKAQHGPGILSECYSAEMTTALQALEKNHADDDKLKTIKARWAKACPSR
jgi:hypothetical protein